MSGMDEWKALTSFEVTLPSGIRVKAMYRNMELLLLGGNIDSAVMKELHESSDRELDAIEPDKRRRLLAEGVRLQHETVRTHLLEVSGEPVGELTERDIDLLPQADVNQLARYIGREDPVPLAPARSSETSPDSHEANGREPTLPSVTVGASIQPGQ